MAIFSGDLGGLGAGAESTPGTGVAAGGFGNAGSGAAGGKQQTLDEPDVLGYGVKTPKPRGIWVNGPGNRFLLNYASGAFQEALFLHVFGQVSGTTTKTYAIDDATPDNANLSLWKDLGGYVDRLLGFKVDSIEWVIEAGFVPCAFEGAGMGVDHPSAVTITVPAVATLAHSNDVTVFTIDSTTYLAALKRAVVRMEIPHTTEERHFLGNDNISERVRLGARRVSFTGTFELRDATPDLTALIDDWEANTALGAFQLTISDGTRSFTWTIPNLICQGNPKQLDSRPTEWECAAVGTGLSLVWTQS